MAGVFAGAFWLAKREVRRVWISYPLAGLLLLFMGFLQARIFMGGAAAVAFALVILEWTVDLRLAERTVGLAQAHGALPAVLSILTGSVSVMVLACVAAGRLEKRNLTESGST